MRKTAGKLISDKLFILNDLTTICPNQGTLRRHPESNFPGDGSPCHFRNKFSKAWRASSGLDVEVSRSIVERGE